MTVNPEIAKNTSCTYDASTAGFPSPLRGGQGGVQTGKELDDETGYSYFGARYYDPNISIWLSVDPLSDEYPGHSPYNYAINNPVKFIDHIGENPAVPIAIVGGVAITAADAMLISLGVITTGIVLYQAQDGSLAVNPSITNFFRDYKDNPGYREQQRREGASQREASSIRKTHSESVGDNIGKPSPEGSNTPKGGGSEIGKIVVGTGLAAEFTKGLIENSSSNNPIHNNVSQANGTTQTTLSQGYSREAAPGKTDLKLTMPVYNAPADNTRVKTPSIHLQFDE